MIIEKFKSFFEKRKEQKENLILNKILNRCSNSITGIIGVAGSGKSIFLEKLTEYQYKNNYSYIVCGNSIQDLTPHFKKHTNKDNVFIFVFNYEKTHSIDINSFFSCEKVLIELCNSNLIEELKSIKSEDWFTFFNIEENEKYFKENNFKQLKNLMDNGILNYNGDFNNKNIDKEVYIYTGFDITTKFNIKSENEESFIFLINILQYFCEKKLNIIFDEEKTFFRIYSKRYKFINQYKNNNYVFTSQSPIELSDVNQIICFRTVVKFYLQQKKINSIKNFYIGLSSLKPGQFFVITKNNDFFREKPYKVMYENNVFFNIFISVDISEYINNNCKKMYKTLDETLKINNNVGKKNTKI